MLRERLEQWRRSMFSPPQDFQHRLDPKIDSKESMSGRAGARFDPTRLLARGLDGERCERGLEPSAARLTGVPRALSPAAPYKRPGSATGLFRESL